MTQDEVESVMIGDTVIDTNRDTARTVLFWTEDGQALAVISRTGRLSLIARRCLPRYRLQKRRNGQPKNARENVGTNVIT